ncbi:DUF7547 family protein [Halorhabdus salina]|uniref:DUF7547 family protein n=1 Tax=Halorhabdus salina TaxID=2750670 RepID=UPI0015EF4D57|nr:hypothetical protein [Halorhabdus salina]
MSNQSVGPSPRELVGELVRTLQELQRTVKAGPQHRRGLDRLRQFTTEVTIPATILILQTNIKMLQLLQRALKLADDTDRPAEESTAPAVGQSVVDRIDEALSEVQSRIDTESGDERTRELLSDAQRLNRRLEQQLPEDAEDDAVAVDVDAELASLKSQYDDATTDGTDAGERGSDGE